MAETNYLVSAIPSESSRLKELISTGTLVSIYLVNGVHLRGYILGFDTYTILLKLNLATTANCQLIYKHAIATILPNTSTS